MNKEQKELLERLYNETGIDLFYEIENNKPDNIDELMEVLQERVSEIEVIYYNNAIEHLRENDPSLQESLSLAHDMGYTADRINSELLATLLKQQEASEIIWTFKDELEELFYNNEEL